ncbi:MULTISPECIES: hypothetical protein [unclassified Streptomyces]|uniref:hypothetical protein n=1 Tax=unclassified Streptomyces TaxID=2593676 RepID=UPI003829F977
MPNSGNAQDAEGRYDLRRGAASYAPIVGAFGALSLPTVTVLFTAERPPGQDTLIAMACGLLVVAMIASLTGSIALAAIGAERDHTANLPAAVMYAAVPVVISLLSILASFQALAAVYLPHEKTLFAVTTGVGGLAGTYFTSFAIGDSWQAGPRDPAVRQGWRPSQWIKGKDDAYRKANRVAITSAVPAAAGIVLYALGLHFRIGSTGVNWLVACSLVLAVAGTFLGVQRTTHAMEDSAQRGVRSWEAYLTSATMGVYTLAVLVCLP